MNWFYLFLAGICEIGWPLGLKLGVVDSKNKLLWIAFAVISMGVSGILLFLAQKSIPLGTAYAIWTGIGAVGTFIIGIMLFHDSANAFRIISVMFIVAGIIGLKLSAH
jgi:quaternary ammonium compound-resistance protein SugE